MFEFTIKRKKVIDWNLAIVVLTVFISVLFLVKTLPSTFPLTVNKGSSSVVFVVENLDISAEQEKVLRAAPELAESLGYKACYRLDKDQAKAKPFIEEAAKKGISPPLVAISNNSNILKVMTFPTLNSLEGALD